MIWFVYCFGTPSMLEYVFNLLNVEIHLKMKYFTLKHVVSDILQLNLELYDQVFITFVKHFTLLLPCYWGKHTVLFHNILWTVAGDCGMC